MGSELTAGGAACRGAAAPPRTDLRERRAAPEGFVVGTAWGAGAWGGSGEDMVIASLCSAKLFPILKLAHEPRVGRGLTGRTFPVEAPDASGATPDCANRVPRQKRRNKAEFVGFLRTRWERLGDR